MALQNNSSATPVPSGEVLVLALLTEELKSRRFFSALAELGMDNPYFRPHLDELILNCIGLTDQSNETFDFYSRVMDEHAASIDSKEELVPWQARTVYEKLIEYQKNMPEKG